MNRPLFEELHDVERRMSAAPALALCLDFDGTLSPFEDHPENVRLTPEVRRHLQHADDRRVLLSRLARWAGASR